VGRSDRLQNGKYDVDIDERVLDAPRTTPTHTALVCRCGFRPQVNIARAEAAAPRAFDQRRDLMIGAPNFGLREPLA